MKFETILDAYSLAYLRVIMQLSMTWVGPRKNMSTLRRQRNAFRVRLEKMYRHADQEAGFLAELLIEQAYYHGVDVGLEVADPELFGEDHVALP